MTLESPPTQDPDPTRPDLLRPAGAPGGELPALIAEVERLVLGQRHAIDLCLVALLAGGHALLEDVPGTGKTTLARSLSRALGLGFQRVQFTSDMLPGDVLGLATPDPASGELVFRPGPVFTEVLLADELNRTPPRVQSALLECMNEGQVTVEGERRLLPRPFFVIATQNPLEFEGTYPLPESQLDRFLVRARMAPPAREVERDVLRTHGGRPPAPPRPCLDAERVRALQERRAGVRVDGELTDHVLEVVEATRRSGLFLHGASTRAALGLYRAAQASALLQGRDYCVPDDVRDLVQPVLAHRLVPRESGVPGEDRAGLLLRELLDELPAPA